MKKGTVFGKKQLVLAGLIVALGAAVWINMQFASTNNKAGDLSSADYLAGSGNLGQAVEVNTSVSSLNSAKSELKEQRDELVKTLSETIDNVTESEDVKKNAVAQLSKLTESMNKEGNIETIIKAKGFNDALVIISDNTVTVMVDAKELKQNETLQIQDAVVSQTGVDLSKIKIITVS